MPCCHSSAFIVASIHFEMVGSKKAKLTLATTRAPEQQAMCGSMSNRQMGVPEGLTYPSSCCLAFIGLMMSNKRTPSIRQTKAKMTNGTDLPQNSYKIPPKGGATKQPKLMKAKAKQIFG